MLTLTLLTLELLTSLVPITYTDHHKNIIVFVTPDYAKNQDYLNLTGREANSYAEDHNAVLPNTKIVDEIYKKATCRISPVSFDPGDQTASKKHSDIVKQQIVEICYNPRLIVGGFKDIVYNTSTDKVAIYGWPFPSGNLIQPYNQSHIADYVDYSHGIRLISKIVIINGEINIIRNVDEL